MDRKLQVPAPAPFQDVVSSLPVGPEQGRFGRLMIRLRTAVIWHNVTTTPQRWMAYYLRRRGWVCFYLDDVHRHCGRSRPEGCWLALYEEEMHR